MMADLEKFWRKLRAVTSAEYDQKTMQAREIIATHFEEGDQATMIELKLMIW